MTKSDSIQTGCVFNVQKFSLHDGPGIRDLIFMKGCPLRCQWCSNPESQKTHPEIACNAEKCIGFESCGLCRDVCPQKAISASPDGRVRIERSLCDNCGDCARVCPDKALERIGRNMGTDELLDIVSADQGFHFRSGGGVTVGGGDPILQSDFVGTLLKECQRRGIDTAIETAGFGTWGDLAKIGRYANSILYDVKSLDEAKHVAYTGVSNARILANLVRLADAYPATPLVVRTPVIPGFNDTAAEISAIAAYVRRIRTLKNYQLLPYHRLGVPKYLLLGRSCPFGDVPSPDENSMQNLRAVAREHSIPDADAAGGGAGGHPGVIQ